MRLSDERGGWRGAASKGEAAYIVKYGPLRRHVKGATRDTSGQRAPPRCAVTRQVARYRARAAAGGRRAAVRRKGKRSYDR